MFGLVKRTPRNPGHNAGEEPAGPNVAIPDGGPADAVVPIPDDEQPDQVVPTPDDEQPDQVVPIPNDSRRDTMIELHEIHKLKRTLSKLMEALRMRLTTEQKKEVVKDI